MIGTRMHGSALIATAIGLVAVAAACSVETQASDILCVANQRMICTDCPRPDDDKRPYRGWHTCAADGKTFGACEECAPYKDDDPSAFTAVPGSENVSRPGEPSIEAACSGKIALLAGSDAVDQPFAYGAVLSGATFKIFATSGAPMRSPASVAVSGGAAVAVYRSKQDGLVTTTFTGGAWSPAIGIPDATTDDTPSLVTWGPELKAIFHHADGRYRVATFDPASGGWAPTTAIVGSTTVTPPSGLSAPSAVSTGAPGIAGSSVLVGYTDGAGGLYRQEWRGTTWFASGIRSSTVTAKEGIRPGLVTMTAGAFDLLSAYVNADGVLHASTRTSKDRGSIWSADGVVDESAHPIEGVNGVGISGGRALVVYRDGETKKGWYTIFDPSKTPAWRAPAELVPGTNPALATTPQIVRDTCGGDAVLAFVDAKGNVGVLRFAGDAWKGPYAVRGLPNVSFASIAAAP
jgi:hypothetical protein